MSVINVIFDTVIFFIVNSIVLFQKHKAFTFSEVYVQILYLKNKETHESALFHFEPNFISFWWQPNSETLPCCAIHESLMLNCTSKGLGSQGILGWQVGAWVERASSFRRKKKAKSLARHNSFWEISSKFVQLCKGSLLVLLGFI